LKLAPVESKGRLQNVSTFRLDFPGIRRPVAHSGVWRLVLAVADRNVTGAFMTY
jgi:hypothetical protein